VKTCDWPQQAAAHLQIPWRLVEARPDDVLSTLRDAVLFRQDWRDFNAHCAVVNVLLADERFATIDGMSAVIADRLSFQTPRGRIL
jgi:hypothetical protein